MEPNFHEHDFIVVDKVTPRLWTLKRGDVIVFVPEERHLPLIKRVIWLPGETVRIIDEKVYICDVMDTCNELDERYLPRDFVTSVRSCKKDVFEIGEEGYFVLWDNRDHSTDSRCCFGFTCYKGANYIVYPKDIIGKVLMRLYPDRQVFRNQEETKMHDDSELQVNKKESEDASDELSNDILDGFGDREE